MPSISRRKLLVSAFAVVVLLLGAVAFAATRDWTSPRLGAAVLGKVSELGGIDLTAREFRFNLLRGLELGGVEARAQLENGALDATMDRLVLEHRLGPLLSGKVLVERLVLERPRLELASSAVETTTVVDAPRGGGDAAAPEARPSAAAAPEGSRLELALSELQIVDGALVVRDPTQPAPIVEVSGLGLELRDLRLDPRAASAVEGVSASGSLVADSVVLPSIRGTDVEGALELANGHVVVRELEMPADLGRFRVSDLDLDLTADPYRFAVGLRGEPLDMDTILGSAGKALGTTILELRTNGGLGDTLDLDGEGKLSLEVGRLPDAPVLSAIDRLLPRLPLVGELYEPFELPFRLEGEDIVANAFEIAIGQARLSLQGRVGLDHSLDLRLVARAPRELVEVPEIPREVLDALTNTDGIVELPITVGGTSEDPVARFDRTAWSGLVKNRLKQEVRGEIEEGLGRLLGRRRNNG